MILQIPSVIYVLLTLRLVCDSSAFHVSQVDVIPRRRVPSRRMGTAYDIIVNALSSSRRISISIHGMAPSTENDINTLLTNNPRVETKQIQLSQVSAEIMTCKPTNPNPFSKSKTSKKQPLLFIHGSFHSSWCWAEHFMPYFASLGFPCYALSLRGTGGTFAGEGVRKVRIEDHVHDLTDCIQYIQEYESDSIGSTDLNSVKPVLIAHSFGGITIMKYLEKYLLPRLDSNTSSSVNLPISGVVSICCLPPSGNGKMTMRFLKRSLKDSWKVTSGLAMKKCITNGQLCRELFFDEDSAKVDGITNDDLTRIQERFEMDTIATIDLVDLAKQLPSIHTDKDGKAKFLEDNSTSSTSLPSLVLGAKDDFIVDREGVLELAKYYGVEAVMVSSPHDAMLGFRWRNAADKVKAFLDAEIGNHYNLTEL